MDIIRRNWRRLLGGGIAGAILITLAIVFWPNSEAPTHRDKSTASAAHKPDVEATEHHEEPGAEEPRGSKIDDPAGAPLLSDVKDLSTIPDKDSKVAKAAEPCDVISDAEIERVFKNRQVFFASYKRPVLSNNPQLIRECEYEGAMLDMYGNRTNMTFTVFTELDNAKHEAWNTMATGMSDHFVGDDVINLGLGSFTARKDQVIITIMPTSVQPGITEGDAKSLIKFAQARLP